MSREHALPEQGYSAAERPDPSPHPGKPFDRRLPQGQLGRPLARCIADAYGPRPVAGGGEPPVVFEIYVAKEYSMIFKTN